LQGIDGEMQDHQEVTEQLEEQLLEKQNEINKLKMELEEENEKGKDGEEKS